MGKKSGLIWEKILILNCMNLHNNLRKEGLEAFLFGHCNTQKKKLLQNKKTILYSLWENTDDLRDLFLSQFRESDNITLPEVQWYYKSYNALESLN